MQTEAFQGCQAHNSFVCYAIETSCSLLSQYLLPNGMCALLLPLLNNTRLGEGLITSLFCLSPPVILCPLSSFPPSSLSIPLHHHILYCPLLPSLPCALSCSLSSPPPLPYPPHSSLSHIKSVRQREWWKLQIRLCMGARDAE